LPPFFNGHLGDFLMTTLDQKRETCPCRVCRSDLAYLVPCDFDNAIEFEVIYTDDELQQMERQAAE
jgi:hypothetical protein